MLRLWGPRTGQQVFSTPTGIRFPRFGPDDRLLAAEVRGSDLGLLEVATSREYRTLVRAAAAGKGIYANASNRFDGRLLAVAMRGGVGLWDVKSGKEVAFLDLPGNAFVLFEPSGSLLTNASDGLLRWPVRFEPGLPLSLRLGPPCKLAVPGSGCEVACDSGGRVIACAQFQGAMVIHADSPDQPVRLGPHDDVRMVAVSPDGRMVATGSHHGKGVKIWEARSGKLVKELPILEMISKVCFSPDGKWLATTGGEPRLWAVDSWVEGPRLAGTEPLAFSPDSKLLAVETGHGSVRLVAPDTGLEFARLEDPDQSRARCISFSPDGSQLVTTNRDSPSIHVWDLRLIREQLATMGLDWELPAYAPAPKVDETQPLRVQVELNDPPQSPPVESTAIEAEARKCWG
jgi:eukaryotic-like serine/threonine-protein kinase